MLDLTFIREHPDAVKDALVKLNADAPIDKILELDRQRRDLLQEVEALRAERNSGSKQVVTTAPPSPCTSSGRGQISRSCTERCAGCTVMCLPGWPYSPPLLR